MEVSLDKIRKPIESELREFEGHFRNAMKSHVPLLDRITYYIVKRKGKQIRPVFVFLSAAMFGKVNEKTYRAASMVELLHTATLVHDDVVDDAHIRRGFFSINALWKNKVAVLVGDYFLSKGLLLALESEQYEALRILSVAVRDMVEGELLQIEKARRLDIEESVYFEIIRQKTASLIAAACAAGTASTNENKGDISKIRDFGEAVGIAFQIKDDLFDYGDADIGKPTGIDIKEKKMTLPLIYAVTNADRKTRSWLINSVKRHHNKRKKVKEIVAYVSSSGGIEYAQKKMDEYRDKALTILHEFPDNAYRQALQQLVYFVTTRSK